MKQSLVLLIFSGVLLLSAGIGKAETIAYWGLNDNDLPGGGFGFLAEPSVFPLSAEVNLVGATLAVGGGILDETEINANEDTIYRWLRSFGGTTENALPDVIAGGSLSIQGGTVIDEVAQNNGAYVDFVFSMTGYENLVVSYATRGTATGFSTHQWSWSIDGDNFTDFQTIDGRNVIDWSVHSLDVVPELDDVATVYLRVTLEGATTQAGNNRFDNIQFNADSISPGEGATVVDRFVFHGGWTGSGSAIDTGKVLAKEGNGPQELTYDNLINTSRGLNGIVFDIQDLASPAGLSAADFQFQVSPQGPFSEGDNPASGWAAAPAPTSVAVTEGSPDRVLISWPDNAISDRWLRITILANENTGLASPEVYYIGHLRGETTGSSGGIYTVSFSDVTPIRIEVGQTVDASSTSDIDKNGIVAFADVAAMRSNVGAQLTNITIP